MKLYICECVYNMYTHTHHVYFILWPSILNSWRSLRYINVPCLCLCLFMPFQPFPLSLTLLSSALAFIYSSCSTNTCLIKNIFLNSSMCFIDTSWNRPEDYFLKKSSPKVCLLILERKGVGGETSMWERNTDQLPPVYTLTGDRTCNLGLCPDRGSNSQPFGVRDNAPTN